MTDDPRLAVLVQAVCGVPCNYPVCGCSGGVTEGYRAIAALDAYNREHPRPVVVTDAMVEAFGQKFGELSGNGLWRPHIREALEAALAGAPQSVSAPVAATDAHLDPDGTCPRCWMNWTLFPPVRVDERLADGTYAPGPRVRCVECKGTFLLPLAASDAQPNAGLVQKLDRAAHEYTEAWRDGFAALAEHFRKGGL